MDADWKLGQGILCDEDCEQHAIVKLDGRSMCMDHFELALKRSRSLVDQVLRLGVNGQVDADGT